MTAIDPRLIQMRQVLLQTASEKYKSLVELINQIPLSNDFKIEAIRQINSGFLWAKEGISLVNFNFDEPKKPETETAPVETPEASNEEIKATE